MSPEFAAAPQEHAAAELLHDSIAIASNSQQQIGGKSAEQQSVESTPPRSTKPAAANMQITPAPTPKNADSQPSTNEWLRVGETPLRLGLAPLEMIHTN